MDVIGDHRPTIAVDEDQDRAELRPQILSQIAARREPSNRVGSAEDYCVVAILVEVFGDSPVLLLHILSTFGERPVAVVHGRVGKRRERCRVRTVIGGESDGGGTSPAICSFTARYDPLLSPPHCSHLATSWHTRTTTLC